MSRDFAKRFAAFSVEVEDPEARKDPRIVAAFAARFRDYLRTEKGHRALQVAMVGGFAASTAGSTGLSLAAAVYAQPALAVPGIICALTAAGTALGLVHNTDRPDTTRMVVGALDALARKGAVSAHEEEVEESDTGVRP